MASDPIPAWQQEALDKMGARLREWLPDHKLHLVLIRAPFLDSNGDEITDPAFEELLVTDPDAAQQQLQQEFEADQLDAIERDKHRAAENEAGAQALRTLVASKRRSRTAKRTQPHSSAQQSIPLP